MMAGHLLARGHDPVTASPGSENLPTSTKTLLERVLARLLPASFFRLWGVSRRWRAAAESNTFRAACSRVPARDPWFLMLEDSDDHGQEDQQQQVPCAEGALQAIAMYGSPYRVVLILGELPDLSLASFDSTKNAWEGAVALTKKTEASEGAVALTKKTEASSHERVADEGDGAAAADIVYFLSKLGDVVATIMQRRASRQYSSAVACAGGEEAVAYFLSRSGTVVACDLARGSFAELPLPRILPVYHEYSIDVVACGGTAYAVVLSEFLDTASLHVWEYAGGSWRQVAAMPHAMSHAFHGAKADVKCVGHVDRVMVCVSIMFPTAGRDTLRKKREGKRLKMSMCCGIHASVAGEGKETWPT